MRQPPEWVRVCRYLSVVTVFKWRRTGNGNCNRSPATFFTSAFLLLYFVLVQTFRLVCHKHSTKSHHYVEFFSSFCDEKYNYSWWSVWLFYFCFSVILVFSVTDELKNLFLKQEEKFKENENAKPSAQYALRSTHSGTVITTICKQKPSKYHPDKQWNEHKHVDEGNFFHSSDKLSLALVYFFFYSNDLFWLRCNGIALKNFTFNLVFFACPYTSYPSL